MAKKKSSKKKNGDDKKKSGDKNGSPELKRGQPSPESIKRPGTQGIDLSGLPETIDRHGGAATGRAVAEAMGGTAMERAQKRRRGVAETGARSRFQGEPGLSGYEPSTWITEAHTDPVDTGRVDKSEQIAVAGNVLDDLRRRQEQGENVSGALENLRRKVEGMGGAAAAGQEFMDRLGAAQLGMSPAELQAQEAARRRQMIEAFGGGEGLAEFRRAGIARDRFDAVPEDLRQQAFETQNVAVPRSEAIENVGQGVRSYAEGGLAQQRSAAMGQVDAPTAVTGERPPQGPSPSEIAQQRSEAALNRARAEEVREPEPPPDIPLTNLANDLRQPGLMPPKPGEGNILDPGQMGPPNILSQGHKSKYQIYLNAVSDRYPNASLSERRSKAEQIMRMHGWQVGE